MASTAHAIYCFECLNASFDRRDPPKLETVLHLYAKYTKEEDALNGTEDETMQDHAASAPEHTVGEAAEGDEDLNATHETEELASSPDSRARPQLPSISRLQASSASSRSSSASSPSTVSASSSNSHLTGLTSTTSVNVRPSYASSLSINESYPLFVTWNTVSRSGHKSLRGCIGTFEALPLATGLATYSLTSAFDDTRFSPIPSSLMPALSCALTFLADFEPCDNAMDWTLGLHGLRISFIYRNRKHGATYLPDVAVEQGWTKEETVESLMKKAGWDGSYGSGVARRLLRGSTRSTEQSPKPWEEVNDFRAVRYTGLKSSASYTEWRDFHDWVENQGADFK